jgi:hypothetical protein
MQWSVMSYSQQGNVGMGRAIAYFSSKCATVSIPLTDTQDYDLVVELEGVLKKVQVKTTRFKAKSGFYDVCLVSKGGTKGEKYGTVKDGSCDLLFIATEDGVDYLIPVSEVKVDKLRLNPARDVYIVNRMVG